MINNFFDKVYVITCKDFLKRQCYIREHFNHFSINFDFFVSVDENLFKTDNKISNSEKSLALSHLNCVINAKLNNYKSILICEDDVNFIADLNLNFENFLKVLPSYWNFLQLGNQFWATHWLRRTFISENLYEFKWGTGSHCIAINSNMYDDIINKFQTFDNPVDKMYYSLYSIHKCYCPELFLSDALSENNHLNHYDKKYIFKSSIFHKG